MSSRATTLATLFVVAGNAAAQSSSVISLPFFGYDDQSIVASVVDVQSAITTLALACPTGEDQNDCGLFPYQTLTVGQSTYNMYMSDEGFVGTQQCSTANTVDVVCVESASGSSANFPGVSTTTYAATDVDVLPVTVTDGLGKLTAATGAVASTTGPASTSASATSAATSSGEAISSGSADRTTNGAVQSSSTRSVSQAGSTGSSSSLSGAAMATAVPVVMAAGAGLLGWLL